LECDESGRLVGGFVDFRVFDIGFQVAVKLHQLGRLVYVKPPRKATKPANLIEYRFEPPGTVYFPFLDWHSSLIPEDQPRNEK